MEISLIVENDVIKDMGYQCKSCVYCQASVSLLSRKIKDKKIDEITTFLDKAIVQIQQLNGIFSSNGFRRISFTV